MSLQIPQMGNGSMDFFFLHAFLFSYCFFFNTHLSIAADSISPGQSLTGDQTITSKEGNFVLGFFTPGNSKNYYIGIWYKKVQVQTIVWVANRETPLPDKSSQLKISEDGNLVLLNQTNIPVWSANSSSITSNSTVAVLQDNGNLVLSDGSNSSAVIWQSFDYPADTWLPTGRLGLNKVTGRNQRLTSWRSKEDPAPGPFSLMIDPNVNRQYIIVWNGSKQYYRTGEWNDQIFSEVPEMRSNYIYNFSFQSDDKGSYFNYTLYDPSLISRFVMDVTGQIKQWSWVGVDQSKIWNLIWSQPRAQCNVFSLCGPFGMCNEKDFPCECVQGFEPRFQKEWNLSDWSGGCVRKTRLRCENNSSVNGEEDKFLQISNMQLPENPIVLTVSSIDDCKAACLGNCSCTAYAYNGGCSIWSGELVDLGVASGNSIGQDLYLRLAASELPSSSSKKGKVTGATVGAAVGAVVVLGVVLVVIWRCNRRRLSVSLTVTEGSLVPFGYRDLQIITKNFSEKLGGGGFGSVFKGILPDSTAIAVKKLEGLRQGEKQFRSEVSTIGTVQHVNLIRLRGFCSEGDKRLLVYDYMPNGSLDAHLFGNKSDTLDWKTRFQIALGTARGLAYLHEKCRDCIIHCDIKPENILLDAAFCPKVADFGLAKLMGREFSRVLTTMRGTRGYLAPEWISGLPITSKADVYSYGMMLFEVISGRRNSEQSADGKIFFFPTWAAKKVIEGDVLSLLDHKLESNAVMDELIRAARVAAWCIQDDEDDRPSMGQVVQILEGVLEVNTPPVPRCLQIIAEAPAVALPSQTSSSHTSRARSNGSNSPQTKSSSPTSSKD